MTAHLIRYEVADRVATVTIDRPDKRGALTWAMLAALHEALGRATDDPGVAAVVLAGTGGSFCAGTDLEDLANTPPEERGSRGGSGSGGSAGRRSGGAWTIVECPKPVIAAVDGPAVGLGAELATQCDVRIATPRARFAWNFVRRGLVPDTGAGSFLLPRIVGPTEALRLLLSGDALPAADALRLGFVSAVVEPDELAAAVAAEAARYLAASPFAVARVKQLTYAAMWRPVEEHRVETARLLGECFRSDDHREGVAAFLERREPRFTGG